MSIVGRNMTKERYVPQGRLENSIPPWICIIRCFQKGETKSLLHEKVGPIWWRKSHPIKNRMSKQNSQKKNTNPSYRGETTPVTVPISGFSSSFFEALLNY